MNLDRRLERGNHRETVILERARAEPEVPDVRAALVGRRHPVLVVGENGVVGPERHHPIDVLGRLRTMEGGLQLVDLADLLTAMTDVGVRTGGSCPNIPSVPTTRGRAT